MGTLLVLAALGLSTPARGSYTVLTAVDSVSAPNATSILTLPTTGSFDIDAGSIGYGHGGTQITLASGVTIYLINTLSTLNQGGAPGNPSEQIYIVASAGVSDSSTIAFSVGYGINGALNSFVQTGMITLGIQNGAGSYTAVGSSPLPPGYVSGGYTYSALGTSGNGDVNSLSNGYIGLSVTAVTSNAVPEPASVAMLGLGLLSVASFAARRRIAG
jgi:hypothetical protein